jgi:hypothetical protein
MDMSSLETRVRDAGRERVELLADEFVNAVKSFAPRRTGRGADSVEVVDISDSGDEYVARIEVGEDYMVWQNYGTGIYGPSGEPIRPKHGNVLVFDATIGGLTFATWVRGTEPTHFWERAIDNWPRIVAGLR